MPQTRSTIENRTRGNSNQANADSQTNASTSSARQAVISASYGGFPAVDPPPPPIDGLDPTSAQTRTEFGKLLQQILKLADRSENDVAQYAMHLQQKRPDHFPDVGLYSTSSVSDIITGKQLPKNSQLRLILDACRIADPAMLVTWENARYAIAEREEASTISGVLTARMTELSGRASELHLTVQSLTRAEHAHWEELSRERAKAKKLEEELRTLRGEQFLTDELKKRIDTLETQLKSEQERIVKLTDELNRIRRERKDAEITIALVQAEQHDTQIALSLDDAAHLQFTRAEYERRAKEEVIRRLDALRKENAALHALLATYQAAQHN